MSGSTCKVEKKICFIFDKKNKNYSECVLTSQSERRARSFPVRRLNSAARTFGSRLSLEFSVFLPEHAVVHAVYRMTTAH
jgi:hypothetical protein